MEPSGQFDKIAVIDFGGQTAHLIATKVRRLNVLCEIKDPLAPLDEFREYRGIILSGSPALASDDAGSDYTREILDLDVPVIGFCFGHQEIAKKYGGEVEHTHREYGHAVLHIEHESPIFRGLGPTEAVWMSHGDTVTKTPPGFVELGYTTSGDGDDVRHSNAAIGCDARRRYGFQYHPEVDDTVHGSEMLANFVFQVCGCKPNWTVVNYLHECREAARAVVGPDRKVLVLVSGGVDSSVTAKILADALGPERLRLLHIDNGLMRKDESRRVIDELGALGLGSSLHFVDASSEFLDALKGVVEPEKKRRIIGDTFIAVSNREAEKLALGDFVLGQGTIYPDTIETGGTSRSDVIKTHHNRVPLIEEMIREGRVVEPLADLYKVEVRALGRELGLAEAALERHPFPGPGLGIRVLCSDGHPPEPPPSAADALDRVLNGNALAGAILPIRSVGVKADLRSYEQPVMLHGRRRPSRDLLPLAARIYKEVAGVNRCILDLTGRPPGTVKPVRADLTRERLELLRELDAFVMDGLKRHGLMAAIWQCPTVLVPLEIDGRGRELVILRPIYSERAMTAIPAELPDALVDEFLQRTAHITEVAGVALDLTTKPPGTIEWE